ncbi:MAG: hypothetical protein ACI4TM_09225 [Candidatus Cryptobacteroides sp.]
MNRSVLCLMAAAFILSCCAAPSSTETFIRASGKDADGRYVFCVDMTDSLVTYDFTLFLRADCTDREFAQISDYQIIVSAEAPSGKVYSEQITVPKGVSGNSYARDVLYNYMTGVSPVEYGIWKFYLKFPQEDSLPGFRGAGLRVTSVMKEMN